ncbi:MAG: hypothetical protein Kow0077_16790 [Anaerolineae bacterium]
MIYALLRAGVRVTALIPSGRSLQIDNDHALLRTVEGDAWNRGSLTGRSRGHSAVIHLVGSLRETPSRGQTYHRTNVDSLQNITRMAIEDGVPLLIFLSTSYAPWLPAGYKQSKREAEQYLRRSGIRYTILRAPLVYPRGQLRNPLLILTALVGSIPLLGRPASRWAPLPVDVLARGVAETALRREWPNQVLYGHQLRQLGRDYQQRFQQLQVRPTSPVLSDDEDEDDNLPFGWLP